MTARRETPFPNRQPAIVARPSTNKARSALLFSAAAPATAASTDVIDLNSSNSSCSASDRSLITVHDSSVSSVESSKTFCISSPSTPRNAGSASPGTPPSDQRRIVPIVPIRRRSQKTPSAGGGVSAGRPSLSDVLQLYRTQLTAERSRLEASVAKWKLLPDGTANATVQQILADAGALLRQPFADFERIVEAAIASPVRSERPAEADVRQHWQRLQAQIDDIYERYDRAPGLESPVLPVRPPARQRPKSGIAIATPSTARRPRGAATPCDVRTPAQTQRSSLRTPLTGSRSKIPVL